MYSRNEIGTLADVNLVLVAPFDPTVVSQFESSPHNPCAILRHMECAAYIRFIALHPRAIRFTCNECNAMQRIRRSCPRVALPASHQLLCRREGCATIEDTHPTQRW